MEIEKQRGISVATSVMAFEYKDYSGKYSGYTLVTRILLRIPIELLTAVDSVILVIDSVKGVEEQTRKLMEICRMRHTPVIVFVNKMDRDGRDPFDVLEEVEKELKYCRKALELAY
jgi:peptide chain release factor 3